MSTFPKTQPGFLLLLLAVLLEALPGRCQTPPPLPAGPLLARAPQNTRWEITYSYKREGVPKEKAAPGALDPKENPGSPKSVASDPHPRLVTVIKTPEAPESK